MILSKGRQRTKNSKIKLETSLTSYLHTMKMLIYLQSTTKLRMNFFLIHKNSPKFYLDISFQELVERILKSFKQPLAYKIPHFFHEWTIVNDMTSLTFREIYTASGQKVAYKAFAKCWWELIEAFLCVCAKSFHSCPTSWDPMNCICPWIP